MADEKPLSNDSDYFHSLDSPILYIDGPGDYTVRPIRRSLWAQAKAERDKIYGPSDIQPPPDQPQE